MKTLSRYILLLVCFFAVSGRGETGRETLAKAILEPNDAEKRTQLLSLAGTADPAVSQEAKQRETNERQQKANDFAADLADSDIPF